MESAQVTRLPTSTINLRLPTPVEVGQRAAGRVSAHHERVAGFILPATQSSGFSRCECAELTPEEGARLLEKCRAQKNADLADLAELALYTGMRRGELLGLTWDRVDRARGVVLLERTKSGRRREVPLNGPADALLARRAPDGPSGGLVFGTQSWYTFRGHWQAAVKMTGLEDFRFHDLRHTFASWAVQRGATLPELKDLLGHSSLAMVMRYAHLSPEHLRSAVARLDTVLTSPKITQEITHEPAVETTKGSR
jgi:integrase